MTDPLDPRPWTGLPPAVGPHLQPELPGLADEIVAAIRVGVPEYARPLEGPFGEALRAGVDQALSQFLAMIETPGGERGPGREIYVGLGRGEMRAGRGLDALLSAYRLGARVAWRRLAGAGEAAGLEPRVLYLLAESIFAYIDELSGESIEGYAQEQAAAAGERQRQRRRLAALLIQDPPADTAAIETAALAAGWALPLALAAVFTAGNDAERAANRLGGDVIAARLEPGVCALVPDPDAPGRAALLGAAFSDRRATIGPTRPWQRAAESAARARSLFALAEAGAIEGPPGGVLKADDHAVDLLLGGDRSLARDIGGRALAPLADETDASRDRLQKTLAAWLRHRGRTEKVAAALHVHPQTVRYRLARLRELYGDDLDDADARFELELALRSEGVGASG